MVQGALQRREKKEKSVFAETSAALVSRKQNLDQQKALSRRIRRLDKAKHGFNFFTKVILCAVVVGRGYNIFTKVSGRRWGSTDNTGWTSAFQQKNKMGDLHNLVPDELLQPFGSYPNILNITEEMRSHFHPVIKFPLRNNPDSDSTCNSSGQKMDEIYDYRVTDLTGKVDNSVMVGDKKLPQLFTTREEAVEHARLFPNPLKGFDVGRYDEDRRKMYTSALFDSSSGSSRTVHIGIDIGAPVGTEVYAFEDGIVHSCGYNQEHGDYGHVIVIEHSLSPSSKVYALYGHLAKSVLSNKAGDKIIKGQVIGHVGNTDENGGWTGTHLHFQVAVNAPEKEHDMPGTVTLDNRSTALLEYADPRYILGELY
jgi:hypothetical protein